MKQFLEFVIRQLVEFPDEMMLSEIPSGKTTIFRVQLRQSDVGRIIGRNGQTIQAIRALLASSAARHGQSRNADKSTPRWSTGQISTQVMHRGDICNRGLNCNIFGGNRDLADFISVTIDVDGNATVIVPGERDEARNAYRTART